MNINENQYNRQQKWIKENWTRLSISYNNEFASKVKQAASASGQSMAAYIKEAIDDRMKKDGFEQEEQKTK